MGSAVLAIDEILDHTRLQRPRPEQRYQRDDIVEAIGHQALDQILHAAGFQLKHRRGLTLLQQFIDRFIIQWQGIDIDFRLPITGLGVDHLNRPIDDGQRTQAEEIKLHQADGLHIILVELGHQSMAGFIAVQGCEIRQPGRRDNHTAGVLAHIAGNAFQLVSHLHDFLGIVIAADEFHQLWLHIEGFLQCHSRLEGNQFREFVPQGIGLALGPRHVPHHCLGGHGAKCNYLGHRIFTV